MALSPINLGTTPNDGTGDDLRTAGGKINANFEALDPATSEATTEAAGLMSAADKAKLDAALTETTGEVLMLNEVPELADELLMRNAATGDFQKVSIENVQTLILGDLQAALEGI